MTVVVGDTWYRYYEMRYAAPVDEFDRPQGDPRVCVKLMELTVRKVTLRGVWLGGNQWVKGRFVLTSARKRYACPTKDEALTSFIARKQRQAAILRAQLRYVEEAIRIAAPGFVYRDSLRP